MSDTDLHKPRLPDGYHSVQPYLIFENADAAIAFYSEVFGATERLRMKDDRGRIAHAELQMGDSVVMLADEHPEIGAHAPRYFGGSPVSLMIYVDNCDATFAKAVEMGAEGFREPADQPYGDRMAGVLDPFGYKWFVAHSISASKETGVTP